MPTVLITGAGRGWVRRCRASGPAPGHRTLYARQLAGMREAIAGIQKRTSPVDKVAAAVERALTAARPKPRYLVGADARVQVALRGALPTRALDAAIIKLTTG